MADRPPDTLPLVPLGTGVFFLMPPLTAVMAWLVLGETLTLREVVGLVIAMVGRRLSPRRRTATRP